MNAVDICDALDGRYAQRQEGIKGEAWIAIREARSGAGFSGNNRQCDYLAINTWESRGLQLVGHEIKVSKADWRKELEDPHKAEVFARYCRRWWVVMPSSLATAVKDEVPPAWGLISVSDAGRCTELQPAPPRKPEVVPEWWWVGWMAQVDRLRKRNERRDLDAAVNKRIEELKPQWESTLTRKHAYEREQAEHLAARVDAFRFETGIDIRHAWDASVKRLGQLWGIANSGLDFTVQAKHLRQAADALDTLTTTREAP